VRRVLVALAVVSQVPAIGFELVFVVVAQQPPPPTLQMKSMSPWVEGAAVDMYDCASTVAARPMPSQA
jgi:hypothetical protein